MKLLVSVRSVDEALAVSAAGADFVDLKEPSAGALGGLPVATIAAIVQALRAAGSTVTISATLGDLPMDALPRILEQVQAVARCGVDLVKVGIERHPHAGAVLDALAVCGPDIVPVFIADRGLDSALQARALALGFPALMADTADKRAGSLFDAVPYAELAAFVAAARTAGTPVGLAGALRLPDVPVLVGLAPDFAGFRSAVCSRGERADALDPARLRLLRDAVAAAQAVPAG